MVAHATARQGARPLDEWHERWRGLAFLGIVSAGQWRASRSPA